MNHDFNSLLAQIGFSEQLLLFGAFYVPSFHDKKGTTVVHLSDPVSFLQYHVVLVLV